MMKAGKGKYYNFYNLCHVVWPEVFTPLLDVSHFWLR